MQRLPLINSKRLQVNACQSEQDSMATFSIRLLASRDNFCFIPSQESFYWDNLFVRQCVVTIQQQAHHLSLREKP